MLTYAAWRLAYAAAQIVPRRVGYRAAALVGEIMYALGRRRRARAEANLQQVLGSASPARLEHVTRLAFRNLVWNYYEVFGLAGARAEGAWRASVEGIEHLEAPPRRPGVGKVVVFGHVGAEVAGHLMLQDPDLRPVVVVERMSNRRVFDLLRRLRRTHGLELVCTDEPRRLIELLESGRLVCIAGDLDSTGTGIVVDLFGRPARVPCGAVKLALSTGAPLLVGEGWRERMDRPDAFCARLSGPLPISGSAHDPKDVRAGVEMVARAIEKQIADRPEQWLAFREVWEPAP